ASWPVPGNKGLAGNTDIPANPPAGDTATTIGDLPVGTECTVTEPTDGSTAGASVTNTNTGSPATITAGETADVTVTNTYQTAVSSLRVTKTIAGSAAGNQGPVRLHVACDNGLARDLDHHTH